jgi:hypothetical protein
MADNLSNRGEPDRSLINLGEPHEIAYWTGRLGISEAELRKAVEHAGNSARNVEAALRGSLK